MRRKHLIALAAPGRTPGVVVRSSITRIDGAYRFRIWVDTELNVDSQVTREVAAALIRNVREHKAARRAS